VHFAIVRVWRPGESQLREVSFRQSVTIPAIASVSEVRRTAKEQHVTMSRALIALAERGVRAEAEAKNN
jgi:hypothetical protein